MTRDTGLKLQEIVRLPMIDLQLFLELAPTTRQETDDRFLMLYKLLMFINVKCFLRKLVHRLLNIQQKYAKLFIYLSICNNITMYKCFKLIFIFEITSMHNHALTLLENLLK